LKKWSTSFSVLQGLIDTCNEVILLLDEFEEQRALHLTEWNFRNIVKNKLHNLLLCKQDFWRKRCTARWVRLGDENTSFFTPWLLLDIEKIPLHLYNVQMVL
jgi:hypothetical protein